MGYYICFGNFMVSNQKIALDIATSLDGQIASSLQDNNLK